MLEMLERDVDLELQVELIKDTMVRQQKTVRGILKRLSEESACQMYTVAQWSQLTTLEEPGKYLIWAEEALSKIICIDVVVEVRLHKLFGQATHHNPAQ